MTTSLPEIPPAGDDRSTLIAFLEFQRAVVMRKSEGLSTEQGRMRIASSALSIAGLLRHLTFVEAYWFTQIFAGEQAPEPWRDAPWDADPDWDFHTADSLALEDLRRELARTWDASRAIVDGASGLDELAAVARDDGRHDLRWILVHLIEEYARHAGHADLIRESIDGVTGD